MARAPSNIVYLESPEKGVDGRGILTLARDPIISDGRIGDFIIQSVTKKLYGPKNAGGWPDLGLIRGAQGWAPKLVAEADGVRRVFKIADWTGGEGAKPSTGYLAADGSVVPDIGEGADFRGEQGPQALIDALDPASVDISDESLIATGAIAEDNVQRQAVEIFDLGGEISRRTISHAQSSRVRKSISTIIVRGYAAKNDGGAAVYRRANQEPVHAGKFRTLDRWTPEGASDSANGGWWEIADQTLSILQFGAVMNSTGVGVGTDASSACSAALTAAIVLRRNLTFPAGGMRWATPVTYDKSAISGDVGFVVNIKGAGTAMTRIFCQGSGLVINGSPTPGIYGSFLEVADFTLASNTSADLTTSGIDVTLCAFVKATRIRATGFGHGLKLTGVISTKIESPFLDVNRIGCLAQVDQSGSFPPNAVTIDQPWISGNHQAGVRLFNPATVNVRGGSIEGNGHEIATVNPNGSGGLLITNPGKGGRLSVDVTGVYFEDNAGVADVLIYNNAASDFPCAHKITGCSFVRLNPSSHTTYGISLIGGDAPQTLCVSGNGFGKLGGYTPNGIRTYIAIEDVNNVCTIVDGGNLYEDAVERPEFSSVYAISSKNGAQACGYVSETGALSAGSTNIASVVRVSAGRYTINLRRGWAGPKMPLVTPYFLRLPVVYTYTDTSVTIDLYTNATPPVLTDAPFAVAIFRPV